MPLGYGDLVVLLDWIEDPIDTLIVGEVYKVSRSAGGGGVMVYDEEGDEQELVRGEWERYIPKPKRKKIVRNLPDWF